MPSLGQRILPEDLLVYEWATLNRIDGRAAAAMALASYLRSAIFVKWNDEDIDSSFGLRQVTEEWPRADVKLEYPSASIIDSEPTELGAHSFTPTILDHTFGAYGEGTVLWKISEITQVFQVDFWCQDVVEREAIAAALPGMFAPGEGRSNVVLRGPEQYYCVPVRCFLEEYQRQDTGQTVYEGERRLLARIRCDVDMLELRCSTIITPEVVVEASEQQDVTPPDAESSRIEPGCFEE